MYGLTLWQTKGIAAGTALVADPAQIVVAVRNDPTVAVSSDAIFTADGAVCRVVARLDCGVNDAAGWSASPPRPSGPRASRARSDRRRATARPGSGLRAWGVALSRGSTAERVTVLSDDGVSRDTMVVRAGAVRARRQLEETRGLKTRRAVAREVDRPLTHMSGGDHVTHRELDALLDGGPGSDMTTQHPDGPKQGLRSTRHDLETPVAWRAAMRRQMPAGYEPPVYGVEDHGRIVRALFALVDALRQNRRWAHIRAAG